ncbi:LegC family aminotransferase [Candidatus Sulfurimonas marisnigri]|uniref:GDP-perosamine synthase n=1 Tax=Candidatus Sulfurimonas marisnigri TaxID=2740405 RepID=A0A7S7RPX5_9BACT|nr:LegC family aminotransferase [Candidatus Sulfurimonas marisnigri]QOY54086.1 LegC family aminotransferase [Candidatus Sulfurimonas marisnigri]
MYKDIIEFIQNVYNTKEFIPLHEPRFIGNEKKYLNDCIESTFVSSVGKYVDTFELEFAKKVGAKYAVATVNGTAALHISLILADVKRDDEVITQPLTFIATCNAISYIGAKPIFVDVDLDTIGLSPKSLEEFLKANCEIIDSTCKNKTTGKTIKACVPMHTFGHACKIQEIQEICDEWHIALVEDAAESLGSYYNNKQTGTFGKLGAFSFNGNKIITSGGGGVIVTDDEKLAKKAKHLTTTAKIPHKWEYVHDEIGFNYRMPNLNAALLVAQLEQLDTFIKSKRDLALKYEELFSSVVDIDFVKEPSNSKSNYWLQAVIVKDVKNRDEFLDFTNKNGVMTRPIWKLMNELEMFKDCQCGGLKNSKYLEQRVVNISSSVVI